MDQQRIAMNYTATCGKNVCWRFESFMTVITRSHALQSRNLGFRVNDTVKHDLRQKFISSYFRNQSRTSSHFHSGSESTFRDPVPPN